jgi:hypothetical protein
MPKPPERYKGMSHISRYSALKGISAISPGMSNTTPKGFIQRGSFVTAIN